MQPYNQENPQTAAQKIRIEKVEYRPASDYFESVRYLSDPVWLDSGFNPETPSNSGRYDILSAEPITKISFDPNSNNADGSSLQPLREALNSICKIAKYEDIPFCGGLIGYISYEANQAYHKVPQRHKNKQQERATQVGMGLYSWALILDHLKRTAQLVFHPDCPDETEVKVREYLLKTSHPVPQKHSMFRLLEPFKASQTAQEYIAQIEKIIEYLSAGDCYQVNLAQHFSARYEGNCAEAYLKLRELTPTPYGAYLGFDERQVLSLSPERFIQIKGQAVQSWPIKGTAPRSSNPAKDAQLARQLSDSEKNRAENLMIVDLMRNDLSTCCKPGSIRVPGLYELQSFPTVHHLVSRVTGELDESYDPVSVLEHCLPGGSITGAPKRRAMQIIAELEQRDRGVYCGCIGYLSSCGAMDTNIAIRTLETDGTTMQAWGGGGIVMDSDPESEFQETLDKIQPLLNQLEQYL